MNAHGVAEEPVRWGQPRPQAHKYDRPVGVFESSVLAAVVGVVLGVIATLLWRRADSSAPASPEPPVQDPAEPSVRDLIALLDVVVVWVGEHDQVLAASPRAVAAGVARGSRVVIQPLLDAIREARMTEAPVRASASLHRGLGVSLDLDARAHPAPDHSVFLIATDKAPEERAAVAVQDFVANTSHELKTPVGAIALLAEALEEEPTDAEMVARFSGRIIVETKRLTELASQLIALSRLQSADPMLTASRIRVGDIVNPVLARFRPLASQRQVVIVSAGDPNLTVVGDPEQLETAVANLVHNAIAYSAERARVIVSTRLAVSEGASVIELAVTDNGIGIPEDEQDRVFERFYRVDYARSRASGGTGLGLTIVRHVAQAHGGDVELWSQVGQGSTFTMRIPAPEGGD